MHKFLVVFFTVCATGCVVTDGSSGGSTSGTQSKSCNASNCTGCCSGGVCFGGNTNSACGVGGESCLTCYAPDVCFSDGNCNLDLTAHWRVQPTSATIASSNNGNYWDADGSPPDVEVTTNCPGNSGGVAYTLQVESYTPTWSSGGCSATAQDLLAGHLLFNLTDMDAVVDDPITGQITYDIMPADLRAGGVSLQGVQGMNGMTFQFIQL